jgi:hypothetical protein
MTRKDIEFRTEDGVTLRGWLYTPDQGTGPFPTIIMAHGYSATKEMYLDDFAAVFAAGGCAALVYDNRNLGASDGTPRGEIVPYQQISDYRDAITFAGTLADVDADRIGVWGSSYSGAHVLVVAALDRRVKCVVSQVPLVSGSENARRLIRSDMIAPTQRMFEADRAARYQGDAPQMIAVVSAEPNQPCALPTADSAAFFLGMRDRAPTWRNEVTLRSVELFLEYEPHVYLPLISPTPLMMVVASGDHLTVQDIALKHYAKALEPKRLLLLPGGHFDAYTGEVFQHNSAEQLAWFRQHLT